MNQPHEIAERFLTKMRAASKSDMIYLRTVVRALLVLLIETAGKRNRLQEHVVELQRDLAETTGRVASLERGGARTLLDAYRGVYRDGDRYARGELATHGGGLWFCLVDTAARPGSGPHWVLAVKAGMQSR